MYIYLCWMYWSKSHAYKSVITYTHLPLSITLCTLTICLWLTSLRISNSRARKVDSNLGSLILSKFITESVLLDRLNFKEDLLLTARLCSCPLIICFAELTFAKLPPPITLPRVMPTFVKSVLASSLGLLLAISSVPWRTNRLWFCDLGRQPTFSNKRWGFQRIEK